MLGTGKDRAFARVSSVGDNVSVGVGTPTLEETRPDHAIRSSVAITKLPLGHDILKKKKKKRNKRNAIKKECFS